MSEQEAKADAEQETFLANDFVKLLRQHNRGAAVSVIEEKLREVVAAVRKLGKKGSLSISVVVLPADKNSAYEDMQLAVNVTASNKVPEPSQPAKIYFPTDEGGLSRDHPNQVSIKFD